MKKLILAAVAATFLMPAFAAARPGDTGFMVTAKKFNERDNYATICHDEFGMYAEVAEWNDIKAMIRDNPYMRDFIEDTGLDQKKDSALLYFRGEKWGPRGEAYYIQMRNHEKSKRHDGVIDQIGDHLFELKVRNNNAKPVLCFIPRAHRGHGHHHGNPPPPPPPPPPVPEINVHIIPPPGPVVVDREPRPEPRREPRLLSTSRPYREFHFLNDKCRAEFGRDARVADWEDIQRIVRSPRDLEVFLRENGISRESRDRLIYFGGKYKNPRDRHYYLIYNERSLTPSGVTPIDRMHGNRLNVAAMMHLRSKVLCLVP